MDKPIYKCTQSELYAACRTGTESLEEFLNPMTLFSPIYVHQWALDMYTQINNAELLPNAQARAAAAELKLLQLEAEAKIATGLWQALKRYILKVYPIPEVAAVKLEAAGAAFYEKAAAGKWESLNSLMLAGSIFITENTADLSLGTITPNTFPAAFNDSKDNCVALFKAFIALQETARLQTENKIKANNALYSKLIEMFKDGQQVFKKEEEIKKQFTFDEVLALISTSQTGLKGHIVAAVTNAPIEGVTITSNDEKYATQTDENGQYAFLQITAGEHGFKVEKTGYVTQEFLITLELGITKTLNLTLQPQ